MVTLTLLCQVYGITEGSLTFGLDNEQAMLSVTNPWDPGVKRPDFDLICDIRKKIRSLPITISGRWIESHQDDVKDPDYSTMDHWTLLNIEMDHQAGEYMQSHGSTPTPNQSFGNERVTVSVAGIKLSCFNKQALYTQLSGHYKPFNPTGPKKEWPALNFWRVRDNIPLH